MNDFSQLLNSSDGRKWLALQYVLAELPEGQREEFESALADDVTLCEAVVEACRLSAGVVLAIDAERLAFRPGVISSATIPQKPPWSARFGVLAACASLLTVAVVMIKTQMAEPRRGLLSSDDDSAAHALAGLLQDQLSLGLDPEADVVEMVPDESLSDLVAPEWLLTAVGLDEPESSSDDDPLSDEPNLF